MTAEAGEVGWQCFHCGAFHRDGPYPSECIRERGGCGRTVGSGENDAIFTKVRWTKNADGSNEFVEVETGQPRRWGNLDVHSVIPNHTDMSNARAFAERNRGWLLYVQKWHEWRRWTGVIWAADDRGEAMTRAKETVAALFGEALAMENDGDRKHASTSASNARLEAMLNLAKSELPATPEEFDPPALLLATPICIYDFEKKGPRPPERNDMLTKVAGANFMGFDRTHLLWDNALRDWLGDDELICYFKRLVGYTALGRPGERIIVFAIGPTTTGKTECLETLRLVLGDYATVMNVENLYATKFVDAQRANPELADLKGVRFVKTSEMRKVGRLDVAKLKHLASGTGAIKTRRPYGDTFEFDRKFTIWIDTNVTPKADDDDAFWERVRVVPFDFRIPEHKKVREFSRHLFEKEQAGIMAWIVEGAVEYLDHGLGPLPERCRLGAEAFKKESSSYPAWFDECCVRAEWSSSSNSELFESIKAWGEEQGRDDFNKRGLGDWLKQQGFEQCRVHRVRAWKGLRVKEQSEIDSHEMDGEKDASQ